MKKNRTRKVTACMYCGGEYLYGDLHRCQQGYDKVMESQNKIRAGQIWEPTLTPPPPSPVPVTWPMSYAEANPSVVDYINELHEMILDLGLRIADLEEERG